MTMPTELAHRWMETMRISMSMLMKVQIYKVSQGNTIETLGLALTAWRQINHLLERQFHRLHQRWTRQSMETQSTQISTHHRLMSKLLNLSWTSSSPETIDRAQVEDQHSSKKPGNNPKARMVASLIMRLLRLQKYQHQRQLLRLRHNFHQSKQSCWSLRSQCTSRKPD